MNLVLDLGIPTITSTGSSRNSYDADAAAGIVTDLGFIPSIRL